LNDGGYSHAEFLHVFIQDIMDLSDYELKDLNAVAVSKGPGSYTGLRIGVSAAKGLCFSLDIPLISVDTLESMATSVSEISGLKAPMLDARRMEVYSAIFDQNNHLLRKVDAEIIDENSFQSYLEKGNVYFLGDGAEKCEPILKHQNAIFIKGIFPSANNMSHLSFQKFQKNLFEDVAYFEPFYLKDFRVTQSKK
jgi:tRNA threonylcarbamoyladenosine biosynthesis protein TsaB